MCRCKHFARKCVAWSASTKSVTGVHEHTSGFVLRKSTGDGMAKPAKPIEEVAGGSKTF